MARDFSAFINGTKTSGIQKIVASSRFVEDGKAIEWEVKAISTDEDQAIRKKCNRRVPVVGKRGRFSEEFDHDKYLSALSAACTVYPPVNDAQFQDALGVMGGEAALHKLLLPGEFMEYRAFVMEVNGFDLSMDELEDEAKN